ncbi:MAG TPA: PAS domain-containing protein [Myxococcota bacterium]
MGGNADLARFLIVERNRIEARMARQLGPAAPGPGAPESELLRRFRSFAASALRRSETAQPALDGLRVNERRAAALLDAWVCAAVELAHTDGAALRGALEELLQRFRSALRQTGAGRRARGAPRAQRRAVMAAIDRVADGFLAVDADTGRIVDANPAAGSLLGLARDALLGVDALSFVPELQRDGWWTELDAMTEGAEPRRFTSSLCDASGREIPVHCSVTRFATRTRTLALVLARPR